MQIELGTWLGITNRDLDERPALFVEQLPRLLRNRTRGSARRTSGASWHPRAASWHAQGRDRWQLGVERECQLAARLVEAGQEARPVRLDEPLQLWLSTLELDLWTLRFGIMGFGILEFVSSDSEVFGESLLTGLWKSASYAESVRSPQSYQRTDATLKDKVRVLSNTQKMSVSLQLQLTRILFVACMLRSRGRD